MSSQSFLWLNIGIAFAVAALFIIGRTRIRAPAKLKLKNKNSLYSNHETHMMSEEINKVSGDSAGETKSLNVIFMYNGHTWDAYEVFGVPAGSRPEVIKSAFELALKNSDPESHEFLKTAYRAIFG